MRYDAPQLCKYRHPVGGGYCLRGGPLVLRRGHPEAAGQPPLGRLARVALGEDRGAHGEDLTHKDPLGAAPASMAGDVADGEEGREHGADEEVVSAPPEGDDEDEDEREEGVELR